MDQNHFWNLLAKHLSGNATEEEAVELETLIKAQPELSFAAQHITDVWKLKGRHNIIDAEEAFQKHMQLLEAQENQNFEQQKKLPEPPKRKKKFLLFLFAFMAISLSAGWFLINTSKKININTTVPKAEVSTRPGSRTKLVLPDNSIVWLNSDSKLSYDQGFGTTNRNTVLVGEAFFDVKKSTIPFTIQAQNIEIKVLGTAFNVKSYPNEKATETSLIRGRVEISINKNPDKKFILKPNEKLIVANDADDSKKQDHKKLPIVILKEITHVTDSLMLETSWVANKLIFQDETLREVAMKMERWYNVKIDIKDEKLAEMHVGGGPFENETIKQALVALQIAFNFNFTIKGNQITITH